jgi:hypothetical protein
MSEATYFITHINTTPCFTDEGTEAQRYQESYIKSHVQSLTRTLMLFLLYQCKILSIKAFLQISQIKYRLKTKEEMGSDGIRVYKLIKSVVQIKFRKHLLNYHCNQEPKRQKCNIIALTNNHLFGIPLTNTKIGIFLLDLTYTV